MICPHAQSVIFLLTQIPLTQCCSRPGSKHHHLESIIQFLTLPTITARANPWRRVIDPMVDFTKSVMLTSNVYLMTQLLFSVHRLHIRKSTTAIVRFFSPCSLPLLLSIPPIWRPNTIYVVIAAHCSESAPAWYVTVSPLVSSFNYAFTNSALLASLNSSPSTSSSTA
jgi:hypothetical protein